jgi:spoIIIJ-associated protein
MEWVETTGRTVEEAKDAALDQLGVDEHDAEFELVEEPKFGLFGRLRAEARVRARVRPTTPRPKDDRRDRRKRKPRAGSDEAAGDEASSNGSDAGDLDDTDAAEVPAGRSAARASSTATAKAATTRRQTRQPAAAAASAAAAADKDKDDSAPADSNRDRSVAPEQAARTDNDSRDGGVGMTVPLDEQAEVAREFLDGLMDEMDLDAAIKVEQVDEDTVEINLEGSELGLLIGPKGATLLALQDLARTVVQRKTSAANGRLMVDVAGYRHKRKVALERFARQVAETVRTEGARKVLEPMAAADRKIVHDTVNDIEGVRTISEGEDPRRCVVIIPADD